MILKKKNIFEKVTNLLLNILIFIFGIILLISIYTSFQTKILNKDYTDFFGYSIFEVQTGSMKNEINPGDWIIVKLTHDVKLNDIITYKLDNEYITHRVIQVYNGSYTTKGDANSAKDDPISQNQIVGKVVNILHNFGLFRKTVFNPGVLITIIITLLLFNFAFSKNKTTSEFVNKIKKKIKSIFNNDKESKSTTVIRAEEKKEEVPVVTKIEDEKEEELEKTSMYRVISIDDDVDDKYSDIDDEEELEKTEEEIREEDLEKTSMYRVISVDSSEIDDTLLEIAENEMKTSSKEKGNEQQEEELEVLSENTDPDAGLTDIDLELLKNRRGSRKGKNAIETAMIIKEEELNKLISVLTSEDKKLNNKSIKDSFIKTYIDTKYYNISDDNSKNYIAKIKKSISKTSMDLKAANNDEKYIDVVNLYCDLFLLISHIEQAKNSIEDSKVKKEFYEEEIKRILKDNKNIDSMVDEIFNIQKKYDNTIKYFLTKIETNMFDLNFNKLNDKKDMFGLELKHNISFSKVYSDYIIDKTYSEGIIAEDKMEVLLTLLSSQLIKDMINCKFNNKYILYIPESLYSKGKKFEKILKMIDDRYAKENIYILVTYEDLLKNKEALKDARTSGYKFALVFDRSVSIKNSDRGNIYIADYIFIDKKKINLDNILPSIPEELFNNIIYEDIEEKVGGFGGE